MSLPIQHTVTRLASIQHRLRARPKPPDSPRCGTCGYHWHQIHVCGAPAWTYRYYIGPGLIYVGKTVDLKQRMDWHRGNATWYTNQLTHIRAVLHSSEYAAFEDEAGWITELDPPGNIARPAREHRNN